MPLITVLTEIRAPIELCFDLARNVEVHCQTAAFSKERAVCGKTSGLLVLGDTITFEGIHFGFRQRLTAKIVAFDRPNSFADEMLTGPFRSLTHLHQFESMGEVTVMADTITWVSPLGFIGRLADLFMAPHLRSFLIRRNGELKRVAETTQGP